MSASLTISGVSRKVGQRLVLKDISLTLRQGQFLVLAGESGSGKTTLLRLASGLDRADTGNIHIHGRLVDDAKAIFVPADKRKLAMVFQDFALWPHLSCLENVALATPPTPPTATPPPWPCWTGWGSPPSRGAGRLALRRPAAARRHRPCAGGQTASAPSR